MPNPPTNGKQSYLPVPSRPDTVAPLEAVGRVAPFQQPGRIDGSARLAKLIPKAPTRREREIGREVAYRTVIQEGHYRLQGSAAVAIAQMHEHTHRVVVAGVCAMNDRVRAIANDADRIEIADISAEQKAMYVRHQFGVLEAGCFRVAAEVDRDLYAERRGGLRGLIRGE